MFILKNIIHIVPALHLQSIKSSLYWMLDCSLTISVLWHKLRAVCASLLVLLVSYLYSKSRCALISCHHSLPSLLSCQVPTVCDFMIQSLQNALIIQDLSWRYSEWEETLPFSFRVSNHGDSNCSTQVPQMLGILHHFLLRY